MNKLQKHIIPHFIKWVPLLCAKNRLLASNLYNCRNGHYHMLQHLGFSSIESTVNSTNSLNLGELAKKSRLVREEAQAALLEYFHSTRSLQITDAENMSTNTPEFFDNLLKKIEIGDAKVGRSLARFLRYHPVNEFEPFFESIGLKPSEYSSFLPQKLMFLNDDELLLENYHVLCNYGVPRNRIGKIYKLAREVFGYGYGILRTKLQSYRDLGLKQSLVVKIIASSPDLLIGNVDSEFLEVLEKLKKTGIGYDWLEAHISLDDTYDWKCMLELMHTFRKLSLNDEQVRNVFTLHPDILLESSGRIARCVFGFLLRFGSTLCHVRNVFLEFPDLPVAKFANNLLHCYEFLIEINVNTQDIGRIVCSHPTVLGSCKLKKVKSVLSQLNCGKSKLCQMVNDDPSVLKKWVRGLKLDPPQKQKRVVKVRMMKTEFLLSLGYEDESKEMEEALRKSRGKGIELQERFDSLVSIGLSREDVTHMTKLTPQILNQSIDVIRQKVEFFIKESGYPVSELVKYPKLLAYTTDRVKLRLSMYKWLKDKGAMRGNLALSTLLSCSEEKFVTLYVNSHPRGNEYWKTLKKKVYTK